MTLVVSLLIGLAVFLTIEGDFPQIHLRTHQVQPVIVEPHVFIEALRMCFQAGLTISSAFAILDRCAISSAMTQQATRNIAVGLPALHGLELATNDYGMKTLIALLERSAETGASIDKSLQVLAEQMRAHTHATRLKKIRSVAVKAVIPLGLCFLPAFVLVGVIPIASSLGQTLLH